MTRAAPESPLTHHTLVPQRRVTRIMVRQAHHDNFCYPEPVEGRQLRIFPHNSNHHAFNHQLAFWVDGFKFWVFWSQRHTAAAFEIAL